MKKKLLSAKRTILFLTNSLLLGTMGLSFWLVWQGCYSESIVMPFYRKGNWLVVALYVVLMFAFTKIYGGYRVGFLRVAELIYSQVLSLLFVNAITYLQVSLIARRFANMLPLLLMTIGQIALDALWAYAANRLYFALYPPRKMVLLYQGEQAFSIFHKMNTRQEKFEITHAIEVQGDPEELFELLTDCDGVVLSGIASEKRNALLNYCYENNLRAYVVPTVEDIMLSSSDRIHLFDTPLLLLRNRGLSNENKFLKRCLDLAVSTVAIVLTAPIMLVVALCIKLYDHGPVLFLQNRLTLEGRVFHVYKFRSMVVDAEKDGVARLASKNDDRITPVGKVLRKVRLDELPQLFNIFFGDMSVVGPRPERPEIAAQYVKTMPEFAYRLKIKAGLTGYAQILGKYNTTPQDKLLLDLMYIENYSLFLDLKLILMTIKILFMPESTEGIEQGAVTAENSLAAKHIQPQEAGKK